METSGGYIDKSGKELVPPAYQVAMPFSGGTAHVLLGGHDELHSDVMEKVGGTWMSIDRNDAIVGRENREPPQPHSHSYESELIPFRCERIAR